MHGLDGEEIYGCGVHCCEVRVVVVGGDSETGVLASLVHEVCTSKPAT